MISDAALIALGRFIQVTLSLVSVRIITSILPPAELGNYYLIFTILSFFALALLNPVGVYLNRKTHRWAEERTIYGRLFVYNSYLLLVCLLTVPVVYGFSRDLGMAGTIPLEQLLVFIMVGLFCTTWNQVLVPMLNMLQFRMSFVFFSSLTLGAGLVLSYCAVRQIAPTAIIWLSGQAMAQILVTLGAWFYFRTHIPGEFSLVEVKETCRRGNFANVLKFTFPLSVAALLMWMQGQSYRMIVEQRVGLEFLGMIGLGLGIASNIAAAVESLVQQLYLPVFYREISDADSDRRARAWNRMAQLTLPIFISLAIFVSCLAPFLVDVLAHGKFAGAWLFVAFGAWIELCRMTTSVLASVAHAEMQTRHLIKSYLIGSVLATIGVWIASGQSEARVLVPGVLLVSGITATFTMYLDMKRLMKTKVGIRTIVRSAVQSLPFVAALPLAAKPHSLIFSLAVLSVAGSYFLFIQYRLAKPYLEGGFS